MRKLLLPLLLVLLLVAVCWADFAHETVSVGASVATMTATIYDNPVHPYRQATCVLDPTGGDIRYWLDGTTPTSTTGHYWAASAPGQPNEIHLFVRDALDDQLKGFRAIRVGGTNGSITCSYR